VLSLGGYVLGSVTAAERAELDRHLLDCPACAAELSELEPLALLLAQLPLAEVLALDAPTSTRSPAQTGTVTSRDRGSWRRRAVSIAAALIVGLTAAAVVHLQATGPSATSQATGTPPRPTYGASAGPVRMSLQIDDRSAVTGLVLQVAGVPAHEHCQLIAVSKAGARTIVGSWTADYDGQAHYTAVSPVPPSQLAQLVLLGAHQRPLLTVDTT
jgi:hypothetical protein